LHQLVVVVVVVVETIDKTSTKKKRKLEIARSYDEKAAVCFGFMASQINFYLGFV